MPASFTAFSASVALPVETAFSMSSMTVRMSCWPRTFGSGTAVFVRSNACLPCVSFAQYVLSEALSTALLRTGM